MPLISLEPIWHSLNVADSLVVMGRTAEFSDIKRGDLIFFNTYQRNGNVSVYLGNGDFIHSGTSSGVTVSNMNSSYHREVFEGVIRRVVNEEIKQ